jgi:hypothetical protein
MRTAIIIVPRIPIAGNIAYYLAAADKYLLRAFVCEKMHNFIFICDSTTDLMIFFQKKEPEMHCGIMSSTR